LQEQFLIMKIPNNIILSRNDGVGDMLLMFPMAWAIKNKYPHIKISVLGKQYTKALVDACEYIDEFIDENDFFSKKILISGSTPECIIHVRTNKQVAKRAVALKIPLRIGTSSRLYHWFTCNKLIKLNRNKSNLHEAQLNILLLKPLGIVKKFTTDELSNYFGLTKLEKLQNDFANSINPNKYNLIVHPKSQGSSREWPIAHFISLVNMLDENKFTIFLSGVEKERAFVQQIEDGAKRRVVNLVGKMPLGQLLSFMKNCDGIVANATGPIHLGAALGIDALGLYPPIRPIHPSRWAPLGKKVKVFVLNKACNECKNVKDLCSCMNGIEPVWLYNALENCAAEKSRFKLINE
jgi:heptosyltransferase III